MSRLKSSEKTSKCQVFSFSELKEEPKRWTELELPWAPVALKGGNPFGFFTIHSVAKYHKNEVDLLEISNFFLFPKKMFEKKQK